MTWTKLGDEFPDGAADLSDAAFRTHVEALAWSNRRLLDLVIPKRDLRRFAFSPAVDVTDPDGDAVAQELVVRGWWIDRGDAWFIGARWPEWQRERAQVERGRERETTRKRRQRQHARGDHSICIDCDQQISSSSSSPDPSRVQGGNPARVSLVGVPGGTPTGTKTRCANRGHEHARVTRHGCELCRSEALEAGA